MTTTEIGDLIGQDQLEEALEELKQLLDGSKKLDELVLNSARLSSASKQLRTGKISFLEAEITKNQIRFALLDLLREIEESYEKHPELKPSEDDQPKGKITQKNINGDNIVGSKITHIKRQINLNGKNSTYQEHQKE